MRFLAKLHVRELIHVPWQLPSNIEWKIGSQGPSGTSEGQIVLWSLQSYLRIRKKKLSASFCKPEIRSKKIWNISVTSSCQSVEDSDLSLNAPQHRRVNLIWKQLQGCERDTRHKEKETKWSFLPSAHGWRAGTMVIKQKAKHFFQPLTNVVTQQLIRPLGLQAVKHHTSLFFFWTMYSQSWMWHIVENAFTVTSRAACLEASSTVTLILPSITVRIPFL